MRSRREQKLGFAGFLIGVALLASVVILATTRSPSLTHTNALPNPSRVGDTPFARTSIWNAQLPANAPIASNSTALVAQLEGQVAHYGTWINTDSYSTPIYTVDGSQPRVPVTLDMSATSTSAVELAKALRAGVPIPRDARPAPGTDADLVVWQPSTDTIWELWNARRVGGVWHARWGGRIDKVSRSPGYFTNPPDWGTAATSLSLLGGTIRISEMRAGAINHALAISIPQARTGVVAWPAQRTDGNLNSPDGIPEGTRFRLDPRLNLSKLNLPPLTRLIAAAAQRYGLFVRDQSGAVAFYAEQMTPEQVTRPGVNPYDGPSGFLSNLSPKRLSAAFPWSHLEVVSAPVHPYH